MVKLVNEPFQFTGSFVREPRSPFMITNSRSTNSNEDHFARTKKIAEVFRVFASTTKRIVCGGRGVIAILVGLLSIPFGVFAGIAPVLTLSFNSDFSGQGIQGKVGSKVVGLPPTLVPGKYGKALKLGALSGHLELPSAGILNASEGSIEMWVNPVDWRPNDDRFHVFFDARGQGALHLYKYYKNSQLLMLSTDNRADGPFYTSGIEVAWAPNTWHHIVGTWSSRGILLYVNGVAVTKTPTEARLPATLNPYFSIGDLGWNRPRLSTTLIDEVKIYDRELTARQVFLSYQNRTDENLLPSPEAMTMETAVDPIKNHLRVVVRTDLLDDSDASAKLGIVRKGAELPSNAEDRKFTKGQLTGHLSLPQPDGGEYEVVAEGSNDGKPFSQLRQELSIPSLTWGAVKSLEASNVPSPWSAIRYSDDVVRVWGRAYHFKNGAFPTQIDSLGSPLLTGPIAVRATGRRKPITVLSANPVLQSKSDSEIKLSQSITLNSENVSARLLLSSSVSFDGLVLLRISNLGSDDNQIIGSLKIDIPIKDELAFYRHKWSATGVGISGLLPAGNRVIESESFLPYYWLGNDRSGLFWFAETGQMWPNAETSNALEVSRANGTVMLTLNILQAGQRLPKNWVFTMGIQATPVKGLRPDWRTLRMAPAEKANIEIIWPTPTSDSMKYYGYPEAMDNEAFEARLRKTRAAGKEPIPYVCPTYLSTASPEWPYFRDRWFMGEMQTTPSDVRAYGAGFARISPRGDGWLEFITSKVQKFVQDHSLAGLYFDNTLPMGAYAPQAGLGYTRDGKRFKEYPILAYRDLYQSLYRIQRSPWKGSMPFSIAHASGNLTIPILSFVDAYLNGEQYRGVVKDNYLEVVSLDAFRTEFIGRQWGLIPIFLPEFSAEVASQSGPTRGLMALVMLHDVIIWPLFVNVHEVNRALQALDKFNYVNAEFFPYYGPYPPARGSNKEIHISAYRKSNESLLVIGNLGREPGRDTVCINKQITGEVDKVSSWPDQKDIPFTRNACFEISLPGLDYRFIKIVGRQAR